MLLWTTSLRDLQILELFYGTYLAAEVAYYAYIYAKVDKKHYLKITSHTRAAALVGRFCAGGMGQILADTKLMDYRQLNYITLAGEFFFFSIYSKIKYLIKLFIFFSSNWCNDMGILFTVR